MGDVLPYPVRRHSISKRLRFQVLQRDGHVCQYCGMPASEGRLEIDHIVPVARGGSNEIENLRTACHDCNAGKAALMVEEGVPQLVRREDLWGVPLGTVREFLADAEKYDVPEMFFDCLIEEAHLIRDMEQWKRRREQRS